MRLIRLFKNDLAREILSWANDGIINQSQAEQICGRIGVDYHQIHNRSAGYFVLIALGYIFIGLSLVTLIGANWETIPRPLRMAGVLLLTVSTQLLGLSHYVRSFLDDQKPGKNEKSAIAILFLGNLFFGASIILIAQIYHLGEHMADGVFWWSLGTLPFAVITRSPWLMLQTLTLAFIWFFIEASDGFYPALFPIFFVPAIYLLIVGRSSILLMLTTVAAIGCWFEISLARWWSGNFHLQISEEHLPLTIGLFIVVYSLSQFLSSLDSDKAKDYPAALSLWSLRFGLIFMLVMTFEEPWKQLIRASWPLWVDMSAILLVFTVGSLYLAKLGKKLVTVTALWAVFFFFLVAVGLTGNLAAGTFFQVVFNIFSVSAGVGLIIRGVNDGVSHYFFLGISAILLTALLRYFDLIGNYVGGAMLFMVFAAVMLGAAKYWRHAQTSNTGKEEGI